MLLEAGQEIAVGDEPGPAVVVVEVEVVVVVLGGVQSGF